MDKKEEKEICMENTGADCCPQVVVMCGVSGSGKTFHARQLESEGYVRLSVDAIAWEKCGPDIAVMDAEQVRELFMEAVAVMERRLDGMVGDGKRVVVDATMCRREKRDAVRRICRSHGVEPQFVYLNVPLPVLKERLAARRGEGPDDQIVPEALVERYYAGFDVPDEEEGLAVYG